MNTLMAGAVKARRGRYTSAGYTQDDEFRESELYLEQDTAGFARELIRDSNRLGYSVQELDSDGLPFAFFEEEAQRDQARLRQKKEKTRTKYLREEMTFTQWLEMAVERERRAVAVCCILLALNVVLIAFWGQAMIDGVKKRDIIEKYDQDIAAYETEIAQGRQYIATAQHGERIRNVAQNELGMLREELVDKQIIYIQVPTAAVSRTQEDVVQEEAGLLDWLLSALDIFDFAD